MLLGTQVHVITGSNKAGIARRTAKFSIYGKLYTVSLALQTELTNEEQPPQVASLASTYEGLSFTDVANKLQKIHGKGIYAEGARSATAVANNKR